MTGPATRFAQGSDMQSVRKRRRENTPRNTAPARLATVARVVEQSSIVGIGIGHQKSLLHIRANLRDQNENENDD